MHLPGRARARRRDAVGLLALTAALGPFAAGCEAQPPPPPVWTPPPAAPPAPILVIERDAAVPEDFPIALPDLSEVEVGEHLRLPDGAEVYSLTARTQSDDLSEVARALFATFDGMGLEVERADLPTGQGHMTTLIGRDDTCEIEVGAILRADTQGEPEPGVVLIVTWTDAS